MVTRLPLLLPVALGAALLASACGRGAGGAPAGADGPSAPWVAAEELMPQVVDGRVLVFDCRPRAAYRRGHIAGAWSLPLDELAPPGGEFGAEAKDRLAGMLALTGFELGAHLVVTDGGGQAGMRRAAATCWLLALAGARYCTLLTGGTDSWRAAGGGLVADEPPAPAEPRQVRIPARPPALASLAFVREATSRPEGAIVDVRGDGGDDTLAGGDTSTIGETPAAAGARHARTTPGTSPGTIPGTSPGTTPGTIAGSIPGALRWPILQRQAAGASGAARAPFDIAALERSAAAAGLFAERELVVVGDGLEDGALAWFLLRYGLGVRDAKLFPGGVAAWREHPTLPFAAARPGPAAAL